MTRRCVLWTSLRWFGVLAALGCGGSSADEGPAGRGADAGSVLDAVHSDSKVAYPPPGDGSIADVTKPDVAEGGAPRGDATRDGAVDVAEEDGAPPDAARDGEGSATTPEPFPYTGSPLSSTLVPPHPGTALSSDLFDMTVVNLAAPPALTGLTPFPAFSLAALRLWDVAEWISLEPTNGTFDWTKMDGTIAVAQAHGVNDFIQTFGHIPLWAATDPTAPCPMGEGVGSCSPPTMSALDGYATAMVQRYCGVVKYYEPWNEPNNPSFWSGTNAQLLEISQHVYQIAKDPANCGCTGDVCKPNGGTNPNQVLVPPITGIYASPQSTELEWLDSYLGTSGATYPYADIVAFHGYVQTSAERIPLLMPAFVQLLAAHGLGSLPVWNTEGSFEADSNLTLEESADFVLPYVITQAAVGISRVFWYAYDQCSWGSLYSSALCASYYHTTAPAAQLGPTPAGTSYATTETWLSGATLDSCHSYDNGLWICGLERSAGYHAWVLWASSLPSGVSSLPVPVPQNLDLVDYRDLQNQSSPLPAQLAVTAAPILVETQGM